MNRGRDMEAVDLEGTLGFATFEFVAGVGHPDLPGALLAYPAGTWQSVSALDQSGALAAKCRRFSPELAAGAMDGLKAVWTPYPHGPGNESYCVIFFFYQSSDATWHSMAVFNRESLGSSSPGEQNERH
jgi:hypothetical protein